MDIVHPQIEEYLYSLSPERDALAENMEKEAEKRQFPIVGPLVGRILEQLALLAGARRIFELGSGFGYSAYWFAKGMTRGGSIILTDGSQSNIAQAESVLGPAFPSVTFQGTVGDALEVIEAHEGPFDLIFNDIDKAAYPDVIPKAVPRLRKGGLLISDNVLWFGSVVTREDRPDVRGVQRFNQGIFNHPELMTTILPVRDGLSVSLKR